MTGHLHIVSNYSAAHSLGHAIKSGAVPGDRVLGMYELFALGPLTDMLNLQVRTELLSQYWLEPDDTYWTYTNSVWDQLNLWSGDITLWWSSKSAEEHSFYLIMLKHAERAAEMQTIDVSRLQSEGQPYYSTGIINSEQFASAFPSRGRLSVNALQAGKDQFDGLAKEGASLRYIKDHDLVGGLLDQHDLMLRDSLSESWVKATRVIGHALGLQSKQSVYQCGDLFLLKRLHNLISNGELEGRGGPEMHTLEVRLAPNSN